MTQKKVEARGELERRLEASSKIDDLMEKVSDARAEAEAAAELLIETQKKVSRCKRRLKECERKKPHAKDYPTAPGSSSGGSKSVAVNKVEFKFEIAGTKYHAKAASRLLEEDAGIIDVIRDPKNSYDSNAVAIKAYGRLVGYVPRSEAAKVAKLMDSGYTAEVTSIDASTFYGRKKYRDGYGGSFWDDDYDNEIATAYVTLVCSKTAITAEASAVSETRVSGNGKIDARTLRAALEMLRKTKRLSTNEILVAEGIASNLTRAEIARRQGWSLSKAKENAKSLYKKGSVQKIVGRG